MPSARHENGAARDLVLEYLAISRRRLLAGRYTRNPDAATAGWRIVALGDLEVSSGCAGLDRRRPAMRNHDAGPGASCQGTGD